MSTHKKKQKSRNDSRVAELHRKYPGHGPIPPSKRTVIITLVVTVVVCLALVFLLGRKVHKYVELQTSMGTIKLQLLPEQAPETVARFLKKVNSHAYDHLTFHRVVKGFMIQGIHDPGR